jgi:hypothetical protein
MAIKLDTYSPPNAVITEITCDELGSQLHFEDGEGEARGVHGFDVECCTKDFEPTVGDKIHIWTNEVYGFVITKGHTDKTEMEIDESLLVPLES